MGNTQIVDTATGDVLQLSPGFVPVGMKEYGGILYIASANKDGVGEIGCAPSPIITWDFQDRTYINYKAIQLTNADGGPTNDLTKISSRVKSGNKILPILNIAGDGEIIIGYALPDKRSKTIKSPIITKVVPGDYETLKGVYDLKLYSIGDQATTEINLGSNTYYESKYHKQTTTVHWYMTQEEYKNCDLTKTKRYTKFWQSYPGIAAGSLAIKAVLNDIDYFRVIPNDKDLYLPQNKTVKENDTYYTKSYFKGFEFKTSSGIYVNSFTVSIYNMSDRKYETIYFGSQSSTSLTVDYEPGKDGIKIDGNTYVKPVCTYKDHSIIQQLTFPSAVKDKDISSFSDRISKDTLIRDPFPLSSTGSFYIKNTSSNVWYKMNVTYNDQFGRKLGNYVLYFNPYINDTLGYGGMPVNSLERLNQVTTIDGVTFGVPELKFDVFYTLPNNFQSHKITVSKYPWSHKYVGDLGLDSTHPYEGTSQTFDSPDGTLNLSETQKILDLGVYTKNKKYESLPTSKNYLGTISKAESMPAVTCSIKWLGWISFSTISSLETQDANSTPYLGITLGSTTANLQYKTRLWTQRYNFSIQKSSIPPVHHQPFGLNDWQVLQTTGIFGNSDYTDWPYSGDWKKCSEGKLTIDNCKAKLSGIKYGAGKFYADIENIKTYLYLWHKKKDDKQLDNTGNKVYLGYSDTYHYEAKNVDQSWRDTLPKLTFYKKDFQCPNSKVTTNTYNIAIQVTHYVNQQDEYGDMQKLPAGINYAQAGDNTFATMISTYLQATTLTIKDGEPINYAQFSVLNNNNKAPFPASYTGDWWNTYNVSEKQTITNSGTWIVIAYFTGDFSITYDDTEYKLTSGIPHVIVTKTTKYIVCGNSDHVYRFGLFKDSGTSTNTSTDIKDHPEIILPLVESYYEDIDDNIYQFCNHDANAVPFVGEPWQVNTLNDGTRVGYNWENKKAKAISGGVCSIEGQQIQTEGLANSLDMWKNLTQTEKKFDDQIHTEYSQAQML